MSDFNISELQLRGDFPRDKLNIKKFNDHCSKFFSNIEFNIDYHLGIKIDTNYYDLEKISINCILKFAKFWQEDGLISPATYFECTSLTHGFKKYKQYIIDTCYEHSEKPYSKNDIVRIILVTTVWFLTGLENSIGGKSKLDDGGNHDERKLKRLLERIELPSMPPKLIPPKQKLISLEITQSDLDDNFSRYNWQDMENVVGKLFEKKGYSVSVTPSTGDFGIDIEAKNETEFLGIQVKHWTNDVGFEDIAKTLGVAQKFNKVLIVSTKSGFTLPALEHATNNSYLLELWDGSKLKNELRKIFLETSEIIVDGKFCTKCGLKCVREAHYCHNCGSKILSD